MLTIHYGTDLEKLADALLKELDNNPSENPLAPEIFVVQNHGMGQWLSIYMAQKEGIAANMKFEFPSERIWSLVRTVYPGVPKTLPSDRGALTWSLMRLLQDKRFLSHFNKLRLYIGDEDPVQKELRRFKLSSRIADVFDQYLVYRPDMLLQWEKGKRLYPQNEAEQWQSELWRTLIEQWEKEYEGAWLHRAQLQHDLLDVIDDGKIERHDLPERITVFGLSEMPPAFIQIMVKLAGLTKVNFYQLSVDPEVHDADAFTNPLVQSLAKQSVTVSAYLGRYVSENQQVVVAPKMLPHESVTSKQRLFNKLKNNLLEDELPDADSDISPDPTLQVHACHSAMREVEVLYDQLLAVLDANPDINPDDILIMTPDIETYAPLIEAVFDAPDEGQPEIPHSIMDRGIQGTNPAIQTFLKVLDLCQSRFKVTDVFDLLDAHPVQAAFGFSDEDLNRLERWIGENRIRWGIDGEFRGELNVPASSNHTWKAGVNRMLLGYAMKPDEEQLYDGIYPYKEIDTSDDAALAGTFSHLLNKLFSLHNNIQKGKTISEWGELLSDLPEIFIPDDRRYFWELSTIYNALEDLQEQALLGGFDKQIPFRVVYTWLKDKLEETGTGGGQIGRGVTFSSLVPMRNIPFKMIGMIGMNDGAFPRSKIPIEFDLMHLEPRPGDPVRSEADRYLFLESLLSAKSHIYFSYVGQSDRQDTEFPPSVVLTELLDYLEEYYGIETEDLVTKHRLQAFSPDYFEDGKYFSYSETQMNISRQLAGGGFHPKPFMKQELPDPDEAWKDLSTGDFVAFFQHPARFLFQNRLGIYLGENDVLTEDREPFTLAGLDSYKVGQELLDRFTKNKPLEAYKKVLDSRDMLPGGWSGEWAFQEKAEEVRAFGQAVSRQLDQQQLEDRELDLDINGFHLVGKLSDVYESARITYRFGSIRPKDMIESWIEHLLFQLVKGDHTGYSRYFAWDSKKSRLEEQLLPPVNEAGDLLAGLLNFYWEGLKRNTYFFPESSFTYAHEVCHRDKDPEYGLKRAAYVWQRDYGYPGESEDPYNQLLLGAENPLQHDAFRKAAVAFWGPFFEVLNQQEGTG